MNERTKKAFKTETINNRGMGIFATKILDGQSVGIDLVSFDFNQSEDNVNFVIDDVEKDDNFIGWVFDEDFFEKVEAIQPLIPEMKEDFIKMRKLVAKKLEEK